MTVKWFKVFARLVVVVCFVLANVSCEVDMTAGGRRNRPAFQAGDRVELVGSGRKTIVLRLAPPAMCSRTYRYWVRMPEVTKGFLSPGIAGELLLAEFELRLQASQGK